jgi:hypothetical protein
MASAKYRLTPRTAKDVVTAVGVVLVVSMVLYSLPDDLDTDLPRGVVFAVTAAGAGVYLLWRQVVSLIAKSRDRQRRSYSSRHRRRSPKQ